MSSQLSQFHYQLSQNALQPDFDDENFQTEDIYHHYSLKVGSRFFKALIFYHNLAHAYSNFSLHG